MCRRTDKARSPTVENTSTVYELAGDFYGRHTYAQTEPITPAVNAAVRHESTNATKPTMQPSASTHRSSLRDVTLVDNDLYQ